MLVLSRKRNEVIEIGDDIRIVVLGVKDRGNKIILGIEAPKQLPVYREEIAIAIREGRPKPVKKVS